MIEQWRYCKNLCKYRSKSLTLVSFSFPSSLLLVLNWWKAFCSCFQTHCSVMKSKRLCSIVFYSILLPCFCVRLSAIFCSENIHATMSIFFFIYALRISDMSFIDFSLRSLLDAVLVSKLILQFVRMDNRTDLPILFNISFKLAPSHILSKMYTSRWVV